MKQEKGFGCAPKPFCCFSAFLLLLQSQFVSATCLEDILIMSSVTPPTASDNLVCWMASSKSSLVVRTYDVADDVCPMNVTVAVMA